ncbi:GDP-L-fucose synthase family protein [Capnocytophaga sputigena]
MTKRATIFLTGGTGMVGSNIQEHPKSNEYTLLAPTSKEVDLTSYEQVNHYIANNQPDIIIHSAGLVGGIQANIKNPVNFLVRNLQMGLNVILAAQENNVKQLLNLASSCMYPRDMEIGLTEDMILKGELEPTNEGYAIAKVVATRLCEYMNRESPEWQYKTAIPCNLYGKYDKFDPAHSHMVPAVIRKIYEAKQKGIKEVEIWGDGLSRREFMFAGDLADFVFYALENFDKMPQNLNVGLGTDYTINEYYQSIAKIIGYEGSFIHDLSKPMGMKKKMIDNTLLTAFGWKPKTSLENGLKQTLEYFKNTIL